METHVTFVNRGVDLNVLAEQYVNSMAPQGRRLDDALEAFRTGRQQDAAAAFAALASDIAQHGLSSNMYGQDD